MTPRLLALLTLLSAPVAFADPITISHSGYLLDATDQGVSGSRTMTFAIVDGTGAPQWSATCAVTAHAGYYAVVLGDATSCGSGLTTSAIPTGTDRSLEVTVGSTTLSPRVSLTAVPTATTSADAQALITRLGTPGTINAGGNPVEWTQLKGVPATIATGGLTTAPTAAGQYLRSSGAGAWSVGALSQGDVQAALGTASASTSGYLTSTDFTTFTKPTALLGTTAGNHQFLSAISAAGAPTWTQPSFADVSGTLGTSAGGTGLTTFATGDLLYASGAGTLARLPVGTNGQVLQLVSGLPTWAAAAGGSSNVPSGATAPACTGTNLGALFFTTGDNVLRICNGSTFQAVGGTSGGTSADPHFSNVVYLLHFDGTSGSSTFTDQKGHAVTATATTVQGVTVKFGSGAATFNGTSSNLAMPSTDFANLSGDWTVEAWVYPTEMNAGTHYQVFSNGWPLQVYVRNNTLECYVSSGNTSSYIVNVLTGPAGSVSLNAWSHIAFVKQGNTYSTFVNGIAGNTTTTASAPGTTNHPSVNLGVFGPGMYSYYKGYLDDLRVTRVARYQTSFAVPTAAFPD